MVVIVVFLFTFDTLTDENSSTCFSCRSFFTFLLENTVHQLNEIYFRVFDSLYTVGFFKSIERHEFFSTSESSFSV